MKDATGELSMTAVAVVAIAAIGVVFTTLIWPNIRQNILRSTYCSQAFNCTAGDGNSNMDDCIYCTSDDCTSTANIKCPHQSDINKQ